MANYDTAIRKATLEATRLQRDQHNAATHLSFADRRGQIRNGGIREDDLRNRLLRVALCFKRDIRSANSAHAQYAGILRGQECFRGIAVQIERAGSERGCASQC